VKYTLTLDMAYDEAEDIFEFLAQIAPLGVWTILSERHSAGGGWPSFTFAAEDKEALKKLYRIYNGGEADEEDDDFDSDFEEFFEQENS